MVLEPVRELRRTPSPPSDYDVLGPLQTGPVANRNPPTPATQHPSNENAAIRLTRKNATSGLQGHNLEGDANESDSEDRPMVPADDDPEESEVPVPRNTHSSAPNSNAEDQADPDTQDELDANEEDHPDANSEYRRIVQGHDNPAVSEGTGSPKYRRSRT